jgi:hypothetical protein
MTRVRRIWRASSDAQACALLVGVLVEFGLHLFQFFQRCALGFDGSFNGSQLAFKVIIAGLQVLQFRHSTL